MSRIVYLHGFASSPASSKARMFSDRFRERGIEIQVPDLAAGDFEHMTITGQLRVIGEACAGEPASLIGSSLGGYLAAIYASRHLEVEKLVLMAPAFCFARRWGGGFEETSRVVYHYGEGRERRVGPQLLEDARHYEDFPDFSQPTLIFHGTRDDVVPAELSERFAATRPNSRLQMVDSDHQLLDVFNRIWDESWRFLCG